MNLSQMVSSCYIHIPFCSTICSYCDFCKLLYNEKIVDKYLDSLEQEISKKYKGEVLETIYIGGGTPSALSITQLNRLFKILSKLKKGVNVEYTIEGNFESTSQEKLDLYKKYGINRLSFGIESVNEENLKFLERTLNKGKVKNIIKYSKDIGINNINIDLMYAIPGEDLDTLKKDVDFILDLGITHISTYSLIIEKHTKLSIEKTKYIDEDLDSLMYKLICNKLKSWDHYEISNFAIDSNFRSRHNMVYWKNKKYYGFGLGAASFVDKTRYCNTRSINKYLSGDYVVSYSLEELNINDMIYYEVILNLRTKDGIDLRDFRKKFGVRFEDIYNYEGLVKDNLLQCINDRLFISENFWYVSNEVIIKLLESKSL